MPTPLDELIEALRCLPGVGAKGAQRMAHHLLQRERRGAQRLARAIEAALATLTHCARCNAFSETAVCARCSDPARDASVVCVVESPADMEAIEQTHTYGGLYYVLMGRLSPLDGIGPKELELERLLARLAAPEVREVVLATNFTNEGEATAHWIAERVRPRGVTVTRLARGVPLGSELEYVDAATVAHALIDRRRLDAT